MDHKTSPCARAVAFVHQVFHTLELFHQAARLALGAHGKAQVALEVRVVAPISHENVLGSEAPGDFRCLLAHARQNEIGAAWDVGDTHSVQPTAKLSAIGAHFIGVAAYEIPVPDSFDCAG